MEESSELEEIGVYHVWFISSYGWWWWSTILGQYNPGKKKTPGLLKYCSCVFNAKVSSKIYINTDTVQPTLIAPLIAGSFGVSAGLWSPSLDQHQRRRSNEFPLGAAFSSCQCPIFFGGSSCTWLDGFPVHHGPQTMPFTTLHLGPSKHQLLPVDSPVVGLSASMWGWVKTPYTCSSHQNSW